MLAWFVEKLLRRQERQLGEPLNYLRKLYRLSPAAFWKFGAIGPLANHRKTAPAAEYYVARLTSARKAGCRECMNSVAALARREDVPEAVIEAALNRPEDLPARLALVRRFAEAVIDDAPAVNELRSEVARSLGDAALVDLAFAVIVGQAFPILKRGIGRTAPEMAAAGRPSGSLAATEA